MMSDIVEHRSDDYATKKEDGFINCGLNVHRHKTIKGFQILVNRKDVMSTLDILMNLKESNPVGLAEYIVVNWIID